MSPIRRIVFFGTPEFAVPALEALVDAGRAPILVVSQPARPAGRERRLVDPPVAARARALGLPVEQPEKVRSPEFVARFADLAPDLAVVVAFGQIFPKALLDGPRLGCLNLHASLLPRWRGAGPIHAAIAAGDERTGICLMRMEEGLDTGPVLARKELEIGPIDTAGALSSRLAEAGAELLVDSLPRLERGELTAEPQSAEGATYAPKLGGVRLLSTSDDCRNLFREFRASTPEPGATFWCRGERVKVLELALAPGNGAPPGRIVGIVGGALRVGCDGGAVDLVRVQRPGGRPISGRDLANGLRLSPGDALE